MRNPADDLHVVLPPEPSLRRKGPDSLHPLLRRALNVLRLSGSCSLNAVYRWKSASGGDCSKVCRPMSNLKHVPCPEKAWDYDAAMEQAVSLVCDTHAAMLRLTDRDPCHRQAEVVVLEQVNLLGHDLAGSADIKVAKNHAVKRVTGMNVAVIRLAITPFQLV